MGSFGSSRLWNRLNCGPIFLPFYTRQKDVSSGLTFLFSSSWMNCVHSCHRQRVGGAPPLCLHAPFGKEDVVKHLHTLKKYVEVFNLYLNFFFYQLMLTSLEYILTLCGVIVRWSFLWTGGQTVVMKLEKRVLFPPPFFMFHCYSKTFSKLVLWWEEQKKRKKSIGGVMYVDLQNHGDCWHAGWDFSMDSKDNWYKMFTCFGFYFLNHHYRFIFKKALSHPN